jgi:hypothetical protein
VAIIPDQETIPMPDFLEDKRKEMQSRLKKLQPAVDEYHRLEAAVAALADIDDDSGSSASRNGRRRGPGRPRGSTSAKPANAKAAGKPGARAKASSARPGRRKGSGSRAAEALSFVQRQPGITIPVLAGKMGIKQNYLYRVLPGLEQEKKVRKDGRGWHPVP